jgi:DNA helicase II / ATP-dependent DNA helicase PcrA
MNRAFVPTAAQNEAITTPVSDVLAVAGPGSGKTAVLARRIQYAIEGGVRPEEIVAITFTNAAARELLERLGTVKAHENGDESMPPIDAPVAIGFIGTLHSFALRMLKEYGSGLGYGERLSLVSPEAAADLLESKARALASKPPPLSTLLKIKAKGISADKPAGFDLARMIVGTFLEEMRAAGILDYDLLLQEFLRLLTDSGTTAIVAREAIRERFSHLFVDEVQDSAPIDWRIYNAFPAVRKFLVGDPDQAIYGFRGGRVREMIAHAAIPGVEVLRLEENFRSAPEICAAAQRLISRNANRLEKETRAATKGRGEVRFLPAFETDVDEVAGISREIREVSRFSDAAPSVAVLARTNAIADEFRRGLADRGITVAEIKRTALPRDFLFARTFVELCANPENDALAMFYLIAKAELAGETPAAARAHVHKLRLAAAAAGETINRRALKFSRITNPEVALEALAAVACRETRAIAAELFRDLPRGSSVLDLALALASVREYATEEGEGVRVLTMHSAKGREFDAVFVVGFEDEAIPGVAGKGGDPVEVEEERRLAYVAATRARSLLVFSHASKRSSKWQRGAVRTESRFLAELRGGCE